MIFAPVRLGETSLNAEAVAADKKSCKRFGPCGVGKEALFLNSYFIDRRYYVAFSSVRRVFKRVAMSQGGFSGQGVFGAIPYLVVQYDGGKEKQCTFKREEDVDAMLAYIGEVHPEIPTLSVGGEQRLEQKAKEEAARYLSELTSDAQSAKEELEKAQKFLSGYPELTDRLSKAARAKRVNQHTNPAYRWVALAIVLAGAAALLTPAPGPEAAELLLRGAVYAGVYGLAACVSGTAELVYGIISWRNGGDFGMYFALFGFAAIFFFSGAHVLPTAKNNKKAVARAWEEAQANLAHVLPDDFPLPARYAHPVVLTRMIRILREGRAQSADEALEVLKSDLKALNADVQVSQEEYDEVVAIKSMFLLSDYQ